MLPELLNVLFKTLALVSVATFHLSMVCAQGSGSPGMVLPACVVLSNPSNCCPSQWTEPCTLLINFSLNLFYSHPQFLNSVWSLCGKGVLLKWNHLCFMFNQLTNVLRRLCINASMHKIQPMIIYHVNGDLIFLVI